MGAVVHDNASFLPENVLASVPAARSEASSGFKFGRFCSCGLGHRACQNKIVPGYFRLSKTLQDALCQVFSSFEANDYYGCEHELSTLNSVLENNFPSHVHKDFLFVLMIIRFGATNFSASPYFNQQAHATLLLNGLPSTANSQILAAFECLLLSKPFSVVVSILAACGHLIDKAKGLKGLLIELIQRTRSQDLGDLDLLALKMIGRDHFTRGFDEILKLELHREDDKRDIFVKIASAGEPNQFAYLTALPLLKIPRDNPQLYVSLPPIAKFFILTSLVFVDFACSLHAALLLDPAMAVFVKNEEICLVAVAASLKRLRCFRFLMQIVPKMAFFPSGSPMTAFVLSLRCIDCGLLKILAESVNLTNLQDHLRQSILELALLVGSLTAFSFLVEEYLGKSRAIELLQALPITDLLTQRSVDVSEIQSICKYLREQLKWRSEENVFGD